MKAKRKKKISDYEKVKEILTEECDELERETKLAIRKSELIIDIEKHNIFKLKKTLRRQKKLKK